MLNSNLYSSLSLCGASPQGVPLAVVPSLAPLVPREHLTYAFLLGLEQLQRPSLEAQSVGVAFLSEMVCTAPAAPASAPAARQVCLWPTLKCTVQHYVPR